MPVTEPLQIGEAGVCGVMVGVAGIVTVKVNGVPGHGLTLLVGVMV